MDDDSLIAGLTHFPTDIAWDMEEMQALDDIAAEAMAWQPLAEGAYLHLGHCSDEDELVINVVGVPDAGLAGVCLLLTG